MQRLCKELEEEQAEFAALQREYGLLLEARQKARLEGDATAVDATAVDAKDSAAPDALAKLQVRTRARPHYFCVVV